MFHHAVELFLWLLLAFALGAILGCLVRAAFGRGKEEMEYRLTGPMLADAYKAEGGKGTPVGTALGLMGAGAVTAAGTAASATASDAATTDKAAEDTPPAAADTEDTAQAEEKTEKTATGEDATTAATAATLETSAEASPGQEASAEKAPEEEAPQTDTPAKESADSAGGEPSAEDAGAMARFASTPSTASGEAPAEKPKESDHGSGEKAGEEKEEKEQHAPEAKQEEPSDQQEDRKQEDQKWNVPPFSLEKPIAGEPDNLQMISGIGPKLEKMLHDLGIYYFAQIARWTEKDIAEVDDKLQFKGRIERDEWVRQAKLLAEGKMEQFEREYGTGGLKDKSGKTRSGTRTRRT